MKLKGWCYPTAALAALLVTAGSAHAEIVLLTSGRTLTVKSHRFDGDYIVLQMRDGGDVTFDRALVDKVVPDEIPYQEPAPEGTATSPDGTRLPALPPSPYQEIITNLAEAHGVDPLLVQALILVESNNRPWARSQRGAMGLMQLMPSTVRLYNVRNPYDPKTNISAGVQHLKSLIDRWGVEIALAAYNAGEGAVRKFNGVPPYRETRNYVSKILALAGLR
jgi:hypothetical protein